jgi:hypothetical protein
MKDEPKYNCIETTLLYTAISTGDGHSGDTQHQHGPLCAA